MKASSSRPVPASAGGLLCLCIALLVVLSVMLLLTPPAAAQEPPIPRDAAGALARVPPGAMLRVLPCRRGGIELRRTAVGTFDMDLPGSYWTLSLTAVRRWWCHATAIHRLAGDVAGLRSA